MKSTDLMPVRDVRIALKSVKDEAYARGVEAGRAEATRMLEFAVRLNGHGPRTLKAIMGEDDVANLGRNAESGAIADAPNNRVHGHAVGDSDSGTSPPEDLILLAYCEALEEAKEHHPDGDGGTIAEYLRGLLHDPEEAAAFVASLSDGGVSLKAFDESKHPRGDDGRFIGREAIHAAKSDPAKAEALRARTTDPAERAKLDAALEGKEDLGRTKAGLHKEKVEQTKKEKAERIQKVRTLAEEISMARRGGEPVPPEHYTELAAELPHLTRDQLRSVRTSLAASFFGRTKRDDMVTALVRHAKVKAEQLRAEQADNDPLDFSIEAMSNTGGIGHADAGRSELNPWREFDKADDRRFGEAQHGGRIEQRQQVMNATGAADKTSAGTPDTGSVLKIPNKVADEQLTQKLQADKQAEPASKQVTQDKPGERGGNWGDSLEPSDGISTPMTKEEFIAQEIRKLREEYPGNDDETYQAQAELNAMDWKPPPEKGKYEVGETVSVDGELGSYRGTFTGKDGNKYAVIASAKGGQYSIPVDKVERGKFEIVGTGDEPKPTFKPQQTPAESRRAAKRLRDEQASRPANKSHKYTDEELAAMEAEDLAADAAPATDTPAPATLKQPSQESRNNAPPASEVGGPFAASSVKGAASAPTGWVGDDLLLINHAYRHLKNTDPAYKDMTLDQFKDQLIRENGKGVTLSRADLPQALDPNDVRESQAQHPAMRGRHGGDFHFIKVPRASSGQKEIPEETGVSGADAPKASNIPPVASDSSGAEQPNQSGFNPEAAVRVAADDITKLRKSDVFRVVEWSPPESRAAVAEYISQHRPDLHGELSEVVNELGVAAPQNGSKTSTGGTFSDNDFSNGNTHEKKIGPASLQYGVNENTGRIELYSLRVPGSHRRKGAAKEAMKAFLAEADQRGLPVELLASPLDKKTNLGKLVNFYQSLGFEVIGRGNPAGDPKMLRKPQPTLAKSFSALSWSALRDELQVAYDAPPG